MMESDTLSFKYQANLTYFDRKNIVYIEIQTLKPALIADIVRLADVGTATVDRVLNGLASVCPANHQHTASKSRHRKWHICYWKR